MCLLLRCACAREEIKFYVSVLAASSFRCELNFVSPATSWIKFYEFNTDTVNRAQFKKKNINKNKTEVELKEPTLRACETKMREPLVC